VRRLHDAGHEVGVHHLVHELLYDYTPEAFRSELRCARSMIEDQIGAPVLGFRAPSWSVGEDNMWVLDVLAEEGFRYDSSLFPVRNHLFGVKRGNPHVHRRPGGLLEVPPTVFEVTRGLRVPFSSGFFFRVTPGSVIGRLIDRINGTRRPVVVALHPWEVFPDFERPPLPVTKSIIPYAGLDGCGPKLEDLLEQHRFRSVREVVLR
jgi:polysaccharide deacetylase family protein (PEP-CTERM system associated)